MVIWRIDLPDDLLKKIRPDEIYNLQLNHTLE